jgi:hypothetical protein
MDAATKMVVVNGETLLVVLHTLLEVLGSLIAHAKVVERVSLGWTLVLVLDLNLDGLFKSIDSWLKVRQLVKNLALQEQSFSITGLYFNQP